MPQWAFEEGKVKEKVRESLPEEWGLRVFKVTSGDSGKRYWVQVLYRKCDHPTYIPLCECQEGKFNAPLIIAGKGSFFWCKHAEHLMVEHFK